MGRIDRQQVGPLYRPKRVKIPFKSVPPLSVVPINLSQSSSPNRRTSKEMGSGKGSESGNSRILFLAIPSAKKERKVTPSNRSYLTKSVYKQRAFQDGDSQVSKKIDNGHRSDGCISSCSDTSDIQKVPSVRLRT